MYIFSSIRSSKKYALQIVTIGSGMLLKTIYFNHVKSGDRKIRKFIKELSNTTKYGYTIYINPTDIYDYKRLTEDIKKSENVYEFVGGSKQLSVVRYYNIELDPDNTKRLLKKCKETSRLIIYNNIMDTFKSIESILYRWPTFSVIDACLPIPQIKDNNLILYLKAYVSYRTVMSSNNEDLYLEMSNCRVEMCSILSDQTDVMINNQKLLINLKDCTIPNLFNIYDYISLKKFSKLYPSYALKILLK